MNPVNKGFLLVLDLKDMLCSFIASSWYLLAFELVNNILDQSSLKGPGDVSHPFSWALEKDFRNLFSHKESFYNDDTLVYIPTTEISDQNTIKTLNFLASWGHQISPWKGPNTLKGNIVFRIGLDSWVMVTTLILSQGHKSVNSTKNKKTTSDLSRDGQVLLILYF